MAVSNKLFNLIANETDMEEASKELQSQKKQAQFQGLLSKKNRAKSAEKKMTKTSKKKKSGNRPNEKDKHAALPQGVSPH